MDEAVRGGSVWMYMFVRGALFRCRGELVRGEPAVHLINARRARKLNVASATAVAVRLRIRWARIQRRRAVGT